MIWLCRHIKWRRKDHSYKMFLLLLEGMLCPVPCGTNIRRPGVRAQKKTRLLLPCGSCYGLRLDLCCTFGARRLSPGDPISKYGGLCGSIFLWFLRPGRLSLEGIYCVRESLSQPGPIPAGPSHGPPEAGDVYWGLGSFLVCMFPTAGL